VSECTQADRSIEIAAHRLELVGPLYLFASVTLDRAASLAGPLPFHFLIRLQRLSHRTRQLIATKLEPARSNTMKKKSLGKKVHNCGRALCSPQLWTILHKGWMEKRMYQHR